MHSLQWGFKLFQERSLRAELQLSQVQTPGARCACLQQAAILQQQQNQKLPEALKRRKGSPVTTPKSQFLQSLLTFEGPRKSSMLAI